MANCDFNRRKPVQFKYKLFTVEVMYHTFQNLYKGNDKVLCYNSLKVPIQ